MWSTLLLLLLVGASNAFVVPNAVPRTALAPHTSRSTISAAEREISISPTQALVSGGGVLGIVGAAFCTSTGSPPTGLAVAMVTVLALYIGAGVVETQADESQPGKDASSAANKGDISISPLQAAVSVLGVLGIVGAAACTSTGSPPTGLAVATATVALLYGGATLVEAEASE